MFVYVGTVDIIESVVLQNTFDGLVDGSGVVNYNLSFFCLNTFDNQLTKTFCTKSIKIDHLICFGSNEFTLGTVNRLLFLVLNMLI